MENNFITSDILVYTDGSCHTQKRIGAWVAIILYHHKKIILQGNEINTTHNRMELMAVIKAIEYVEKNIKKEIVIKITTDSQYVMGLSERAGKLIAENFITKKGKDLQNTDLLKKLFHLFSSNTINLTRIRAHQKNVGIDNYNTVADKLSRNIVRRLADER